MKKAQVTLFIILGIIALAATLVIFAVRPQSSIPAIRYNQQATACMKQTASDALIFIGARGGYYKVPLPSYDNRLPYYAYYAENHAITTEQLEREIAAYIDDNLFYCHARTGGVNASARSNAIAGKDAVFIWANITFTIGSERTTSSIAVTIPARLSIIHNVSAAIAEQQAKDLNTTCLSCILRLSMQNDLKIDLYNLENSTQLVEITDNKAPSPYLYRFVNKVGD